jgi:DNA polymerase
MESKAADRPGAPPLSDANPDAPNSIRRQVRQRLESLRRAGLDRLPRPPEFAPAARPVARAAGPIPSPGPPAARAPESRPDAAGPGPAPARPEPAPAPRPTPPPRPAPGPAIPLGGLFDEPEPDLGPFIPPEAREDALRVIRDEVAGCPRCPVLVESRTQTVFGEGSPTARLMFIGEAPGADEDRTGRPFVGRAGQLLNDMITKGMGLRREDVYIANVLKCRPPGNRDPQPDEVAHCRGYLERQLAVVRPKFLCILGRIAAQALLETAVPLARLRGRWHNVRGIQAIVTYHPAYLLRNPESKRDAWEDLKTLMRAMELKPPDRKGAGG